jgi:hypothetical protein
MLLKNPMKDKMTKIIHLLNHSLIDVCRSKNLISRRMVQTRYFALCSIGNGLIGPSANDNVHHQGPKDPGPREETNVIIFTLTFIKPFNPIFINKNDLKTWWHHLPRLDLCLCHWKLKEYPKQQTWYLYSKEVWYFYLKN